MSELTSNNFDSFVKLLNFEKGFTLLIGFIFLNLVVRMTKFFATLLGETFPTKRIFFSQIQAVFAYIFYIIGGTYLTFSVIAPTKEIVLAISGSAAVAIGFSLKDLVASIIAGMILIFDRPFQVGDRVQFDDHYGDIISIGLRAVRLQTLDDSTITIPNSRFITGAVTSANMGSLDMQVETYLYFPLSANQELIKKSLYEIAATSRFVLLKKKVVVHVSQVLSEGKVLMKYTVKAYVIDTQFEPSLKTDISLQANKLLKDEFLATS